MNFYSFFKFMHACSAKNDFVRGVVIIIGILDMIFGELDGVVFYSFLFLLPYA